MSDNSAIVAALRAAFLAEYVEALGDSMQLGFLPVGVPVPADLATAATDTSAAWLAANIDTALLVDPATDLVAHGATRTASAIYAAVVGSARPSAAQQTPDWQRVTTELATARQAYGPDGTDRPVITSPSDWAAPDGSLAWNAFDTVQPPAPGGNTPLVVHLEHARVTITRDLDGASWWCRPFFTDPAWFVPGMDAGALLPSATAAPMDVPGGVWIVPQSLLLVRNLTVTPLAADATAAPVPSGVQLLGVFGPSVTMIPPVRDAALGRPVASGAGARRVGDVGIDVSFAAIDPADAVRNGAKFVIRYSAGVGNSQPATAGKLCRKGEIAAAVAAGLDVIANSEWTETRVTEGAAAGAADGAADLAFWKARGLARGASIYCSWDAAPNPGQFDAVAAYLSAYDHALGGYYHVDLYAGDRALNYLLDKAIIRYGWRPNAGSWSGDPHGQYYQPAHHGLPVADTMRTLTRAHLWQTGNYWYGKNADEDLVLRAPVGSHLDALAAPGS